MFVARPSVSSIQKGLDRFSQAKPEEDPLADFDDIVFGTGESLVQDEGLDTFDDIVFGTGKSLADEPLASEPLIDEEATLAEPGPSVVKDLILPTLKGAAKVSVSTLMSIGLAPGAAIRAAIELIPTVTTPGSLDRAEETFKEIMAAPQKLITTPEEQQAMENVGKAFIPFEMAGEGWRQIGEAANEGLIALGFESTYIEPLLATYGEAAAVFGLPGVIRGVQNSTSFRKLTIRERGLVIQSLADTVKRNPNMTEGQILKEFKNPNWRREALKSRELGENVSAQAEAIKNDIKGFELEAAEVKGVSKRPVKPEEGVTTHVFISKKGHHYDKINGKWYGSRGREISNRFVIVAAEKGKVEPGLELEPVIPEVVEPTPIPEPKLSRRFEEIKEETIEPVVEIDLAPKPEVLPEPTFRTTSEETALQAETFKGIKIDNHDTAIAVATNYVNQWLDGVEVDIDAVRDVLDREVEEITDPVLKKIARDTAEWARKAEREVLEPEVVAEEPKPLTDEEAVDKLLGVLEEKKDPTTKLTSGIDPSDVVKGVKQLTNFLLRKTKSSTKPSEPHSSVKEEAKEQILKRGGSLGVANYETAKFTDSIDQRTTKQQREVMPFIREKTDIPDEAGRPDLQEVLERDKEHLQPIVDEAGEWLDQGFKKIKKHMPDLTVKQLDDYITHLWDIPRNQRAAARKWFSTQNRFLEKRFIATYKEGIERGYKPKTLDISEIIRVHDNISNRAIENSKYIKALLAMKEDGVTLIHRGEEAPADWVEIDIPALSRRVPLSKGQAGKKGQFTKEVKVYVHPELVRPLKVIFEERFDHPVISAYEAINGVMKKTTLSLSLFHHGALGETGIALIGPVGTGKIYFDPVKIFKALARGEFDVFAKEDIAKDGILHNLQFGATADIPINKIQGYLNDLARMTNDVTLVNRVTSLMKDANSVWDKALWSYLHDTLKLYAYESLVGKMDPTLNAEMTTKTKREIAQFVNDTFGGQNWESLMMTPKEVQMMTWGLLSADWTLSTTRQALALTGIGKIYKETSGVRKKMAWRYWAKAALYFGVGMNLLNAMYRNKDMEENPQYYEDKDYPFFDKTMFRNTVGKKSLWFKGRYEDGSERYVRWGKQFRDFPELLMDPLKKLGGKAAPFLQLMSEIFTGHTLSGFKNDDVYGAKGLDKVIGITKTIIKSPLPISLKRFMQENLEFKPLDIMMQSSKGMSRYTAMEYFKKGIIDGDEDAIRDTYVGALKNNLPAFTLFGGALAWIESEILADLSDDVKNIEDARAALKLATSARDKNRYGTILRRLEKDKADKRAGLKLLKSAIQRASIYMETSEDRKPPMLPSFRSSGGGDIKANEDIVFD